jgi:hypothetical protein
MAAAALADFIQEQQLPMAALAVVAMVDQQLLLQQAAA